VGLRVPTTIHVGFPLHPLLWGQEMLLVSLHSRGPSKLSGSVVCLWGCRWLLSKPELVSGACSFPSLCVKVFPRYQILKLRCKLVSAHCVCSVISCPSSWLGSLARAHLVSASGLLCVLLPAIPAQAQVQPALSCPLLPGIYTSTSFLSKPRVESLTRTSFHFWRGPDDTTCAQKCPLSLFSHQDASSRTWQLTFCVAWGTEQWTGWFLRPEGPGAHNMA
jgi:hypothetical protein